MRRRARTARPGRRSPSPPPSVADPLPPFLANMVMWLEPRVAQVTLGAGDRVLELRDLISGMPPWTAPLATAPSWQSQDATLGSRPVWIHTAGAYLQGSFNAAYLTGANESFLYLWVGVLNAATTPSTVADWRSTGGQPTIWRPTASSVRLVNPGSSGSYPDAVVGLNTPGLALVGCDGSTLQAFSALSAGAVTRVVTTIPSRLAETALPRLNTVTTGTGALNAQTVACLAMWKFGVGAVLDNATIVAIRDWANARFGL